MNKYLIYTVEGYCEGPDGEEIANCQVLGRIEAESKDGAIYKFFYENTWPSAHGFNADHAMAVQLNDDEEAD